MKTTLKYIMVAVLLTCQTVTFAQINGQAKHVILITIDGMRPDFYMEAKWPARTLQTLAKEGIHARGMRPVNPSVTLPDHTTMITGALPARHGVYHNQPFDPAGWAAGGYSNASQIKVETLWDAVKKAGGTSAAVNWPVSGGAPVDWNYQTKRPANIVPKEFLEDIQNHVIGKIEPREAGAKSSDFDDYNQDLQTAQVSAHIIAKHKPNLMTIHFLATDHAQHEQGKEGEKVYKAVAVADICLNQIVEATKKAGIYENTVFVICGDHGFEDRHTQLAWNALLIKEGLLENKADRGNWKACFKDQFLMLKDKNDKQTLARVRKLLEEQPPQIRKLYRIVERRELDQYGTDPEAMLAVQTIEGVVCTSRFNFSELVQSTPGGSHGMMPERPSLNAGFVAFGPGLRSRMEVPQIGMEDVAPLIAFSLGIPFKAPDGIVYPGMIAESVIKGY